MSSLNGNVLYEASPIYSRPDVWRSGGTSSRILNSGTTWRSKASPTPRPLYRQVPIGEEAGRATELVWTRWWRGKSPAPTGTQTRDHPACSPALYHIHV